MTEVIPTILTSNPQELKDLINQAEEAVDRVQIDVIDGQFAQNKTVDLSIFETLETNLNLDFHLMTKEPADWVEKTIRAMADRVIGHIEMMTSQIEFVEKCIENGILTGLAIDLKTPVSDIDPEALAKSDIVLVMSVPAGLGGQTFDKRAIEKIKSLKEIKEKEDLKYRIGVDGGVTKEVAGDLAKAGADEVFVGRRLFQGNLEENIEDFKQ